MNTFVLQLDQEGLQDLSRRLSKYQVYNANPYVYFAAKIKQVTILIYKSGKVVFQGKKTLEVVQELGYDPHSQPNTKKVKQDIPLIGSDEVGNGSYFGGLAVVASFVTAADHDFLRQLGVDDSKNLSDHKIRQIAPLLEERLPYKALFLTAKKYNQIVGKGLKHNAISVKVALHNQAIFLLLQEGVRPQKIVVDAFTSQKNYQKYLKNEENHFSNPLSLEEKAEGKYLAVATSSIIARKLFLENLEKLSQDMGLDLPSGAGQQADQVASQVLKVYGEAGLQASAKWHFKNTEKAYQLLKE